MVSIEEFERIAGVKEATIRKNHDKIPGLTYRDGTYEILSGTRYLCDFSKYKMDDSEQKRYALLKVISRNKYVSNKDLNLYQEQFVTMLRELLDAGLIQPNGVENHYGANAYDCTMRGEEILRKHRKKCVEELVSLVAGAAGTFTGKVISEVVA